MDTQDSDDDLPPLIDIPREDLTDIPPEVRLQPSSSSSGTLKDIVASGAKAGVETLAKAGATAIAKSFLQYKIYTVLIYVETTPHI